MATTNLGKVAVVPRGEYAADVQYEKLDIVQYERQSYLVKQSVLGVIPSTGSQYVLLAGRGDSSYEVAVKNGYVGTEAEWLLHIKADGSIQALQKFMTNPAETDVQVPDYGTIPSLQGHVKQMFENGGLPATPFESKVLLDASSLADGSYGVVTNSADSSVNGVYLKKAGVWVKTKYGGSTGNIAVLHGNANKIDLNTTSNIMTIKGRIFAGGKSYTVDTTVNVAPVSSSVKYLSFNVDTSTVSVVSATTTDKNEYFFASIATEFGNPIINGVANYYVNGVANEGYIYRNTSLVMNRPSDIVFDFANNEIRVNKLWTPYKSGRILVTDKVIALTGSRNRSEDINYVLVQNRRTFNVELKRGDAIFNLQEYDVVLAGFNESSLSIFGLSAYTINGREVNLGSDVVANQFQNSRLVVNIPKQFHFDFTNDVIKIDGIWLPYKGGRLGLFSKTVALAGGRNRLKSYNDIVVYNTNNLTVYVREANASFAYTEDEVVLCAYNERDRNIWGLEQYSINGVAYGTAKNQIPVTFPYSTGRPEPLNVTDDFRLSQTVNYQNIRSNIVYGWYDELLAEFPEYITKTQIGMDASGALPIYSYLFKPTRYKKNGGVFPPRPKIMIQALHNENVNFIYPYIVMREMCRNWQNNTGLEGLRWGTEILVVPVGNPWGLDNGQRTNSNGVDINRNYPEGWVLQTELPQIHSGTAPLSESETVASYNQLKTFKPHIFIDCHSFGSHKENGMAVWLTSLSQEDNEVISNTIHAYYSAHIKAHPWAVPFEDFFEVHDLRNEYGRAADAGKGFNMLGGSFETSRNLKGDAEASVGGSVIANNFAADIFLLYLLKNIEHLVTKGLTYRVVS